jgi:glycosyltransferase involved in cell wall biosynthesis
MPLHLAYFYDLPLPYQAAAPIQILRTARAVAELGAGVTVFASAIAPEGPDRVLQFYGIKPHPLLSLRRYFPDEKRSSFRPALRQRLAEFPEPLVVMSRGESGIQLYPHLPPGTCFVYEAHRTCYGHLLERTRGASPLAWPINQLRIARTRFRERRAVENAHGLVCLNRFVRDALAKAFDIADRPTLILPSGTDCTAANDRDVLADDIRDIDILYVGKFDDRKGVRLLVQAMTLLPEFRLTLVGGSESQCRDLREFARSKGIPDDRLHLPGYVEPARIRELSERARVGACPLPGANSSVAEFFTSPMKVLEMMASGTPIVASDLPSVREILRHDETALLVTPNDPPALAAGLRRLLTDRALAARLRSRALLEVQAYSWESRAQKLLDFVTCVATAARSG